MSTPERLAYWYLRLNGFLSIENFVVHPDQGVNQRTDADLLAVRFRHRAENLERPMADDPRVSDVDTYVNLIIAEVKTSACALNGPWTRVPDRNIHRVLAAIGCVEEPKTDAVAKSLYAEGCFQDETATIRLMAFGDRPGELSIPAAQVLYDDMSEFIWDRLRAYDREKRSVGNWAPDGQKLRRAFDGAGNDETAFRNSVRQLFGLPPRGTS
jgi:hypothetical protein